MKSKTGEKRVLSRKFKRDIFAFWVLLLPVLQFCIFYIYINFNSIIMAFSKYELNLEGMGYISTFAGFDNFSVAWNTLTSQTQFLRNSLILYGCTTLLGLTLALVFSYYLSKGYLGSGFFRCILFLPQVVSSISLVLLYRYIVDKGYISFMEMLGREDVQGLLINVDTQFVTLLFYSLFFGFGVNVLLFTGAMSGINESVIESARLEGVSDIQEFIYITIPMIWPTFITFFVVGVAQVFTNQMNLVSFYGVAAEPRVTTIGYFLYSETLQAELTGGIKRLSLPQLSAMGLILTFIIAPLTLIIKKMLEKFGPSTE